MNWKGKRIFNYRPLVFCALSICVGIIIAEAMYGIHYAFFAIPIVLFAVATICLGIFKKTRKYLYIPLALLVGFASMTASGAIYDTKLVSEGRYDNITGTVASEIVVNYSDTTNNNCQFILDDVYIGDKKLAGKAYVFSYVVTSEFEYNAGDIIAIEGSIQNYEHQKFDEDFGYNNYYDGTVYMISASKVHKIAERKPKFPLNIQMAMKRAIYAYLDNANAPLVVGLTLGDTFALSKDLREQVNAIGIAHILAVSGLHITTIATILYFLLKKMRVNSKFAFATVTIGTFAYSMLCSFTPSSLRAVIMTACLNYANAFGKKYDGVNALSFAAILILIFNPVAILNNGFLLSFSSVAGIMLFYRQFRKGGMKIVNKISPKRHFGKRVADSVAVSLAVTAGSLPFIAMLVGRLSLFFLLSNLILLPYAMALYICLIVAVAFAAITGLYQVMIPFRYLMIPLRAVMGLVGSLPIAEIDMFFNWPGMIWYIFILLLLSRYVFIQRDSKIKIALSSTAIAMLAGCAWFAF